MTMKRTLQPSDLGWIAAAATTAIAVQQVLRAGRKMILTNKVALITGGSRGLGLILAQQLTDEGVRVALCARDADELADAEADLKARGVAGNRILTHVCDVTKPEQIQETMAAVKAQFGRLDILINNAGIIQVGPLDSQTEEDFIQAMNVHFWGAYRFVQAALPELRRRKGRIVNISSIGGLVAIPHLMPYSASKAALVSLSQSLRAELLREGVYVTTVCPGLIRTDSPRNALFKGDHEAEYTWFALGDSLPGLSQDAEEAAHQIVEAMVHGDAFVITSAAAEAIARFNGIFPGLMADILGLVNSFLPGTHAEAWVSTSQTIQHGYESETPGDLLSNSPSSRSRRSQS